MLLKLSRDTRKGETFEVRVKPGKLLDIAPRFDIRTRYLHLSSVLSSDQQADFYFKTIGGYGDLDMVPNQLRFDPIYGRLKGFIFSQTGKSLSDGNVLQEFKQRQSQDAILFLENKANFPIYWSLNHCYFGKDDLMISLFNTISPIRIEKRLRIAIDFEFLVFEDNIIGWSLSNVSEYITSVYNIPEKIQNADCLKKVSSILDSLLSLIWMIDDPDNDVILGDDEAMKNKLLDLNSNLISSKQDCHQITYLQKSIKDLLSYFD
ncbi:MAG: hypothetical protein RLP44_01660 [Aggregatilineales bacterium]